jgi:hypothetical protein
MITLRIMGLGEVVIHQCYSEQELNELCTSFLGASIATLIPQAICLINESEDVRKSGILMMPKGEPVMLYSGGVLDNFTEIILSSIVISDPEYKPSDFALA